VRLTVVGCAGSFPAPGVACSSYLVEADGFRLVVDLGNGSLGELQRHVDLAAVDAVLVSHLHGDHWIDLVPYVVALTYGPGGLRRKLPVHGPTGLAERLGIVYGNPSAGAAVLEQVPLTAGHRRVGPFDVTAVRMVHPVETYGFRISHGGRVLAYSADTGPGAPLIELARDCDVLLCEASFLDQPDNVADLHLSGRQAGEHATAAGARRLLLTHLVTAWGDAARTLAEAQGAYHGPVEVVRPGAVYEV